MEIRLTECECRRPCRRRQKEYIVKDEKKKEGDNQNNDARCRLRNNETKNGERERERERKGGACVFV